MFILLNFLYLYNFITTLFSSQFHTETLERFYKKKSDICLYASTILDPKDESFKKIIKEQKYKNILILVGPEAGIDESEIDKLKNWTAITLGPRILRTEVAPLYIMSAISYELELGD